LESNSIFDAFGGIYGHFKQKIDIPVTLKNMTADWSVTEFSSYYDTRFHVKEEKENLFRLTKKD